MSNGAMVKVFMYHFCSCMSQLVVLYIYYSLPYIDYDIKSFSVGDQLVCIS